MKMLWILPSGFFACKYCDDDSFAKMLKTFQQKDAELKKYERADRFGLAEN
jgi:hypothetical protein